MSGRITLLLGLLLLAPAVMGEEEALFEGKPAAHWIEALASDDLPVRQRAAWALWKLRPAAGAKAIAAALSDADAYVRNTCSRTLQEMKEDAKPALPALLEHLSSDRPVVRHAAAFAIFRLGPWIDGYVEKIAAKLSSSDPVVRANLAGCLADAGPLAIAAATALRKQLEDEDAEAARWAARALVGIDPVAAFSDEHRQVRIAALAPCMNGIGAGGRPVFDALVGRLSDPDAEVRSLAANALGNAWLFPSGGADWTTTEKDRVIGMLVAAVRDDPEPVAREWAAYALGKIGSHADGAAFEAVLPSLLRAAADRDPTVRCAGFQGFRSLRRKIPAAVPLLIRAMGDPDTNVRTVATLTLPAVAEPTDEVIAALTGALDDWERNARSYAARGLSAFGGRAAPAVPALIRCWKAHEDPRTRSAVAKALGGIGPAAKAALPLLLEDFVTYDEPLAEVCYALCRMRTQAPRYALYRLVTIAVSDVGGGAQGLLGILGPAAAPAVPMLVRMVETGDPASRVAAVYTLRNMGTVARDALPLLDRLAKEGEGDIREAAQDAVPVIRGE